MTNGTPSTLSQGEMTGWRGSLLAVLAGLEDIRLKKNNEQFEGEVITVE
jgi:hypothetical protein